MKAAVIFQKGEMPRYTEDFPEPIPTSEDEIIISVKAAAIKHLDKSKASGTHDSTKGDIHNAKVPGGDGVGLLADGTRVFALGVSKFTCPGPTEILPYARVYKGKKEAADFFRLIYENKDFPKFEPREFIAEGNKVVALGYWDAISKKTGKHYSSDWAMVFYFRDGKVYEHREFFDSYVEAMASK